MGFIWQRLGVKFRWSDAGLRIGAIPRKIISQPTRISWKACLKAVVIRRDARWLTKIDEDNTSGVDLYRIPGYNRLLWLPQSEPTLPEVEFDLPWFHKYHGADIGGLIGGGDTVLDCGGYAGLFTLHALRSGAHTVVTFEPCAQALECIRRNCEAEIRSGRVIAIPKGVWSTSCALQMSVMGNQCGNTVIAEVAHPGNRSALVGDVVSTLSIPVATIDEVLRDLDVRKVDLCKMDVEGAEREAIIGATALLSKALPPKLLICIYHRQDDPAVIHERVVGINQYYISRAELLERVLVCR